MKAVAKATALCLFAILAVGMVLSPLSAQTDSSRLPMKSLTVGNRWVYNIQRQQIYNYPDDSRYYRVVESVIGDTMLNGKRYAKIWSSYDSTTRFERSNDSAVYAWTPQTGDIVQHSWNFDSTRNVLWNGWTFFPNMTFYTNDSWSSSGKSFRSVIYDNSNLLFNYRYSDLGGSYYGTWSFRYRKAVCLESLVFSSYYATRRGDFTLEAKLIGSIIDGKVEGDTAIAPSFLLSIIDTNLIIHQREKTLTIAVPLVWEGIMSTRIRPPNFARGINISYDSTVLQSVRFIDYKVAKPLQDTILSTQVINEYKKIVQGNIVTASVAVPVPFDNTRGIWMVCTIKPPSKDTTITISLSKDSSTIGIQFNYYNYVNFPVQTQNSQIKISLPSLQMSIGVSELEARNYDTVRVPIFTTGVKARYLIDSTPLPASLSFNASLLEPIGNTQAGTVTNGIRTVPFTCALTPNSDTARAVLLFRAAVGNDNATILTPRIEPQAGINYRATVTNGYVRIRANQAGGEQVQFFSKAPRLRVLAISPNPASDIISVTLSASEKAPVTLSLLNTLGQRIRQAEITVHTDDSQEIPFSVRDVPHGVYMVVIQSQSETLTRQIQILP